MTAKVVKSVGKFPVARHLKEGPLGGQKKKPKSKT